MTKTESQPAKELFNAALEVPPPLRAAFIATQSGGDAGLRSQVEALVAAHESAGSFLASPTFGSGPSPLGPALADRLQRALAGRYSIERELGHGGMGVVYLARDVALDRSVAIKLLPPSLAESMAHRERFLREARTAAALSHPNIVPIHLVEESSDLVYFVMACIDGESLGDRIRRTGPLDAAVVAKLVQEIAWALAYAHSRGVIHRDIKPDNILIDTATGRAVLTDFGIARVSSISTMSHQGEVLGTFRYMSPEQASADAVIDGRADLYSLGVTAFFALTGRTPFEGDDPVTLLSQHIAQPAPPVLSVRGGVPARLAEAIDRCLAKDPAQRFANGELLAEAIADAQVLRRDIPPAVREFLGVATDTILQVNGVAALWLTVAMVMQRVAASRPMIGTPLDPLIAMLGMLSAIVVVRPIAAARSLARAGFDEVDVANAVAARASNDSSTEYRLERSRRLVARLSRPWWRLPMVLTATGYLAFAAQLLIAIATGAKQALPLPSVLAFALSPLTVGFLYAVALAPARVVALFTPGAPENTALLRRIITSGPARWFFRLTAVGLRSKVVRPTLDVAPTEVLLGKAARDLVSQLPAEMRDRLGDLRGVIADLERVASEVRARRRDLEAAIADVGAVENERRAALLVELREARQHVDTRLSRAVSALENLRLDLLRLRAGVARTADLTSSIEAARAASQAVGIELAAQREVEAITGPDDVRDRKIQLFVDPRDET